MKPYAIMYRPYSIILSGSVATVHPDYGKSFRANLGTKSNLRGRLPHSNTVSTHDTLTAARSELQRLNDAHCEHRSRYYIQFRKAGITEQRLAAQR